MVNGRIVATGVACFAFVAGVCCLETHGGDYGWWIMSYNGIYASFQAGSSTYDGSQWGYGWAYRTWSWGGNYTDFNNHAGAWSTSGLLGSVTYDTSTHTRDGYRQLVLMRGRCEERESVSVSFEVDSSVQITGHFDSYNGSPFSSGTCYAYGWAKQILSGLDSKTAETKGTFTASCGDSYIGMGTDDNSFYSAWPPQPQIPGTEPFPPAP